MPKGYNSLNDLQVDFYEIGICPSCGRRLTAECEHTSMSEEAQVALAAFVLAEHELAIEQMAEAEAQDADYADWMQQTEDLRHGG